MAVRYRHTQLGAVVLAVVGLAGAAIIVPAFFVRMPVGALILAGVLLVCLGLFATMTVDVSDRRIAVRFGLGVIRAQLRAGEVRSVQVVRNQWYMGWGVRLLRRGWLYNVSGLDAVEVEMTGGQIHRIGTDEPEALAAAIREAAGLPPNQPLQPTGAAGPPVAARAPLRGARG